MSDVIDPGAANGGSSSGTGGGGSSNGKPPAVARVVQLPIKREVTGVHLENLHQSGLTDETIRLAALYVESHPKRLADLMQIKHWRSTQGTALVFPFYLPGADEPHAYRIRPQTPRIERRKNGRERAVKYDQPKGSPQLIYYTPRARVGDWYADASRPLYWTEGEKKALALDQLGLPCIGLTGVWLWLDSEHRSERGDQLHPTIAKHVAIAGRAHVIVFDADARTNDGIMQAAARLCGVLYAAGATDVRFVVPPDAATKGIDDYYAAHGEAAVRALLATAQPLEPADPKQPLPRLRSLAALREAPLPETLRMPAGYMLERDGALWREADGSGPDGKATRVTHAPMFITRTLVDHYTGEERVEVTYQRSEAWQQQCVSRKGVADARAMVAELAPYGAPVTSSNASKLVDWLHCFEAANDQGIPRVKCVAQTGWHRIDTAHVITSHTTQQAELENEGTMIDVAIDMRGDRRKVFGALAPRGSLEAHVDALRRAFDADPKCAAMICGAFAAPLLLPLEAPNFAIHLLGESSRGKTSMLKCAASAFGDPSSPYWLASWNVSLAAAELRAAMLCDLPQCYDEIGCGDPEQVEAMVYGLVNGTGRNRATRDYGIRESLSWRTVVLSTGEHELAHGDSASGAQVRVLQLGVDGFGKLDAAAIDALVRACCANSGSAGAEWMQQLVNLMNDADARSQLRARYAEAVYAFRTSAPSGMQKRQAAYYAMLAITESLLAVAFNIGTLSGETMQRLYLRELRESQPVIGVGERALQLLEGWVESEHEAFPMLEAGADGDDVPRSARGARHGYRTSDGTIYIIPDNFKQFICERHGLSEPTVVRELVRLGAMQVAPGRHVKQVRIGKRRVRVYVVRLAPPSDKDTHLTTSPLAFEP